MISHREVTLSIMLQSKVLSLPTSCFPYEDEATEWAGHAHARDSEVKSCTPFWTGLSRLWRQKYLPDRIFLWHSLGTRDLGWPGARAAKTSLPWGRTWRSCCGCPQGLTQYLHYNSFSKEILPSIQRNYNISIMKTIGPLKGLNKAKMKIKNSLAPAQRNWMQPIHC